MTTLKSKHSMEEQQILDEVNKIYPGLGVTELKGVSVIDNGKLIYVAQKPMRGNRFIGGLDAAMVAYVIVMAILSLLTLII